MTIINFFSHFNNGFGFQLLDSEEDWVMFLSHLGTNLTLEMAVKACKGSSQIFNEVQARFSGKTLGETNEGGYRN
jgi:lipoprotein signal peptidase